MAGHSHEAGFFAGERLKERAERDPDKTALVARQGRMTFSELDRASTHLASHLAGDGLGRGRRVALLLPNCIEFAVAYYGSQRIGAVTTVLDARLKGKELEGVLRDAEPGLLISHAALLPDISDVLEVFQELPIWVVGGEGPQKFEAKTAGPFAGDLEIPTLNPEDGALILYTSGTTGEPKGAVLSYVNLAQFPNCMRVMHQTGAEEVWGCVLPMSHISGPIYCNEIVDKGSTMVIFDQLNPTSLLEGMSQHGVTIFHGVPIHYQLLLQARNLQDYDLSRIWMVGLMGTTIPLSLMRAVKAMLPQAKVIQGYGLTETSPLITLTESERADEKMASIGTAVPGIEVKIVDGHGDPAEEGEIITRGPHVMKGYFRKPEATAERIRDGWLYTGDIGKRDEDGYYYHLGRKDDMIITGGLNVYPAEVENALCDYPHVREAAVFAVDDRGRGKAIGAAVVPREGQKLEEKALLAHLRANLAPFKLPQRIQILDSMPRTSTGKIRKELLG